MAAYDGPKIGYFRLRWSRWRPIESLTLLGVIGGALEIMNLALGHLRVAAETLGLFALAALGVLGVAYVEYRLGGGRG